MLLANHSGRLYVDVPGAIRRGIAEGATESSGDYQHSIGRKLHCSRVAGMAWHNCILPPGLPQSNPAGTICCWERKLNCVRGWKARKSLANVDCGLFIDARSQQFT